MKPYYEHGGITIYHGDAKTLLPLLSADLLVTDPPYGIGEARGKNKSRGLLTEIVVQEKPILFSGAMVRAILEGRKTQTRRVVQPLPSWKPHSVCDPSGAADSWAVWFHFPETKRVGHIRQCPYGKPGTHLWVRETFSLNHSTHYAHDNGRGVMGMIYRASWNSEADFYGRKFEGERRWRPSIHMPRWASRIKLEIVSIKVERVQDITKVDCIAEGITGLEDVHAGWHQPFAQLWDSINSDRGYGWENNPFVWVIEFKRLEGKR